MCEEYKNLSQLVAILLFERGTLTYDFIAPNVRPTLRMC